MEKKVLQLFIIALLLLTLQAFDYSLNHQLPNAIPVTGAAVSESQTTPCAETSPCKSPTSWKCQSNSKCYDYSDCLFQCPATPTTPVAEEEKKEEPLPAAGCNCGEWETSGGCGEQGCEASAVPQFKSCTGGSGCVTRNWCFESAECVTSMPESLEGVNLVPVLEVQAPAGVKGGGEIVIILKVKNTGTKSTSHPDVVGKCPAGVNINVNCGNAFGASVSFRKGDRYGAAVVQPLLAAVTHLGSLLLDSFSSAKSKYVNKAIKPGESLEVLKETVKIPEDFSGKLVITAAVDAENFYVETRENDNEAPKEVEVQASSLANLKPTEAEAFPAIESLSATVSHVKVVVQNTGERIAVAEQNVGGGYVSDKIFSLKVSILKENVEVCKGGLTETIEAGIKPNEVKRNDVPVRLLTNEQCRLEDKDANYWAVVDVDNYPVGTAIGVFTESNENDNKQTFQLKGPQQCSPFGSRQVDKYCSIGGAGGGAGTWLTQKDASTDCGHNFECKTDLCLCTTNTDPCPQPKKCVSKDKEAGQTCNNNFECKTELCVKSKCVTEAQKEQILKIVG